MMTAMNPNENTKNWKASKRQAAVHLYLSGAAGDVSDLVLASKGFTRAPAGG